MDPSSPPAKQAKEKFDKARELAKRISKVRGRIWRELTSGDEKLRKVATVC